MRIPENSPTTIKLPLNCKEEINTEYCVARQGDGYKIYTDNEEDITHNYIPENEPIYRVEAFGPIYTFKTKSRDYTLLFFEKKIIPADTIREGQDKECTNGAYLFSTTYEDIDNMRNDDNINALKYHPLLGDIKEKVYAIWANSGAQIIDDYPSRLYDVSSGVQICDNIYLFKPIHTVGSHYLLIDMNTMEVLFEFMSGAYISHFNFKRIVWQDEITGYFYMYKINKRELIPYKNFKNVYNVPNCSHFVGRIGNWLYKQRLVLVDWETGKITGKRKPPKIEIPLLTIIRDKIVNIRAAIARWLMILLLLHYNNRAKNHKQD